MPLVPLDWLPKPEIHSELAKVVRRSPIDLPSIWLLIDTDFFMEVPW